MPGIREISQGDGDPLLHTTASSIPRTAPAYTIRLAVMLFSLALQLTIPGPIWSRLVLLPHRPHENSK